MSPEERNFSPKGENRPSTEDFSPKAAKMPAGQPEEWVIRNCWAATAATAATHARVSSASQNVLIGNGATKALAPFVPNGQQAPELVNELARFPAQILRKTAVLHTTFRGGIEVA